MRSTEFRGKQITTGQWLYGSLIRKGKRCFIFPLEGKPKAQDTEVAPKTVGQLTGEIDKHGKRVWEGDWVLAEGINGITLTLVIGWGKRGFIQIEEDGYIYADWFSKLEVIGNIHDGPQPAQSVVGDNNPWRCEKCGSTDVQERVWRNVNTAEIVDGGNCDRADYYCNNCEGHNRLEREGELLRRAIGWWGETDFREMERVTRYRQLDFDPDEGYQAFVNTCNEWWNGKTTDDKITIYLNNQ